MKNLFCIVLFAMIIVSCKKKDEPDDDPSGTPINNITPSDTNYYQALFSSLNTYGKFGNNFTPIGNVTSAYYSSQFIINELYSAANLQDMGTVNLNGVTLKTKSIITNHYYNDTTGSTYTFPHNWNIGGTGSIATFSYSNIHTPPVFTKSANIPDSINISNGFSFNISGTGDCTLIKVFVLGGSGSTAFPNKLFSGTDTVITFSASELQGIVPTNTGYFSVQLLKDHYRTIGGKRVNFRTGLQYFNTAFKIKP